MQNCKKLVLPLSLLLTMTSVSFISQAKGLPENVPVMAEADAGLTMELTSPMNASIGILNEEYVPAGMVERPLNLSSGANVLDPKYSFYPVYTICYALEDAVLKEEPSVDAADAGSVTKYDSFMLTGMSDQTYQEVQVDGKTLYVDKTSITADSNLISEMKAEEERQAEEARRKAEEERKAAEEAARKAEEERLAAEAAAQAAAQAQAEAAAAAQANVTYTPSYGSSETYTGDWNGSVLTASAGVNYGPSGKETYYNLDMSGVVNNMRNMGNNDAYWVRDDGAKMLGDYVIVAANLDVHPRGSLVETSLGTGIVADTGGFAAGNPNQVDIATAW